MRDMSFRYIVHKSGRFLRSEFVVMLSSYYGHGETVTTGSGKFVVWNPFWWRLLPFTNPKLFIKNHQ